MKYLLLLIVSVTTALAGFAQDSIRYRIIFIGEGGKTNTAQQEIFQHAATNILKSKTTVFYLDDSKYLQGKVAAASKEARTSLNTIRLQYEPMRAKGADVYFISANQAWNKMSTAERGKNDVDSLLKVTTGNACPDPVEINITDSLTIIAFNSGWWLMPYDNTNPDDSCECKTKADVIASLDELRYKNKDKFILLASVHPFQSYGVNGSRSTLKDHVFPLTAANKNLYIPMPVVGSLYPFFRSTFTTPKNLKHPLYKDMVKSIDEVFENFPNLVHVSGRDKGLQLIKNKTVQVVSGQEAEHMATRKGKHTLFANTRAGYTIVDMLDNNSLRFTFYNYTHSVQPSFTWTMPYTPVYQDSSFAGQTISGDSVLVQVHPAYDQPGKLHRKFFGENYRKEWAAPTMLPVIRLSRIEGGLTPLKRGGGMQSKSLRLADKQGKEWVIRSVEKSPDALLPENFRQTFARDWLDDATSAQHPFSALVVPPIANAVGVPHAQPVIGIVAPDKNLGIQDRKSVV